jgi:hypothetical protein
MPSDGASLPEVDELDVLDGASGAAVEDESPPQPLRTSPSSIVGTAIRERRLTATTMPDDPKDGPNRRPDEK